MTTTSTNKPTPVVVELYEGPALGAAGTELTTQRLDDETYAWLEAHGWGQDGREDLWVMLSAPDTWLPNNPSAIYRTGLMLAGELDPDEEEEAFITEQVSQNYQSSNGQMGSRTFWIAYTADVLGYGHVEDRIDRALGDGETKQVALDAAARRSGR